MLHVIIYGIGAIEVILSDWRNTDAGPGEKKVSFDVFSINSLCFCIHKSLSNVALFLFLGA